MGYGRLQPSSDPGGSSFREDQPGHATSAPQPSSRSRKKLILLSVLSFALIIASAVSAVLLVGLKTRAVGPTIGHKPTQAISRTCSKTLYPNLCVSSLLNFPGSLTASEQDLVHISFNMTLHHFSRALYFTSGISYLQMDPHVRSAFDDCLELLDDSVDALSRSLGSVLLLPGGDINKREDVLTWLSAALTNHDTCSEGFEDLNGPVKDQVSDKLKDLSELVSNCLAIFSAGGESDDFSGVPIQNRRRRLLSSEEEEDDTWGENDDDDNVPRWVSRETRRLLSLPVPHIQADIIVSKDGTGTVKTIAEAIKKAPENSDRRTIIYVRAGR